MCYRAPEIFLKCTACRKCDIWSIGCMLYELIIGETLFDPSDTDICGESRNTMQLFHQLIGHSLPSYVKSSSLSDVFYKHDMTLKGVKNMTFHNFDNKIMEKLNVRGDIDDISKKKIIAAMKQMLQYEPQHRMSINECVDFFNNL